MNWMTVKNTKEIALEGIAIEAEWRDRTLAALTLTDAKGGAIRLVLENYAVKALVPAPAEKKQVHVVTGAVPTLGTPIREEFDDAYAATARKYDLEGAGVIENAAVKVEEIEIPF